MATSEIVSFILLCGAVERGRDRREVEGSAAVDAGGSTAGGVRGSGDHRWGSLDNGDRTDVARRFRFGIGLLRVLRGGSVSTSTTTAHYRLLDVRRFKALILPCTDDQVKHLPGMFHVKLCG